MSTPRPAPGTVGWFDLTVADAAPVRDFYGQVVGWRPTPVDMGGYSDYAMAPPGSDSAVAGVCHARGENASIPPCWLIYITVGDLDASLERVGALGGEVVCGPRDLGGARFAVARDPSGAAFGLYQPA